MEHKFGAKPIIFTVIAFIVAAAIYFIFTSVLATQTKLLIGSGTYDARVLQNNPDRQRAFSGGFEIGVNQALLLAFPTDGEHSISMKSVSTPIDIVWLDGDKKVVYIVKNTSKKILSQTVYKPKSVARYIVELPVGSVDKDNIMINQVVSFTIKSSDIK